MRRFQRIDATGRTQHGVWTREQARAHGFPDSTIDDLVRRGEWRPLFDGGVFTAAGTPDTWLTRLAGARLRAGADGVVARLSAARLWALPGFEHTDALELVVPREHTPRVPGVRVTRTTYLPGGAVVSHSGLPTTSVSRTLHDLAAVAGSDERLLVAAADAYRLGRTDPMRLLAEVQARARYPGNARLRRVIERLDPRFARTRSVGEILGNVVLVDLGYTDFQVNVRRRLGCGRPVEFDVLFGGRGVLELQSARHHGSVVQRAADLERRRDIERDGFEFAELWPHELADHQRVRSVVDDLLRRCAGR